MAGWALPFTTLGEAELVGTDDAIGRGSGTAAGGAGIGRTSAGISDTAGPGITPDAADAPTDTDGT